MNGKKKEIKRSPVRNHNRGGESLEIKAVKRDELPRYLTEKEVARMTGLSLSTLRNARFHSRGLPYVKIGRSVRYSLEDVIDYMESRKVIPVEDS